MMIKRKGWLSPATWRMLEELQQQVDAEVAAARGAQ